MSLTICSASCCALAEGKVSSARFPCRYIKKAEAVCQAMRRHLPFLMRADPQVTLRLARHNSTKPAVSSSGKYMLRHARQPRPTAAFPRSSGNAGSLYNTCGRSPKDT